MMPLAFGSVWRDRLNQIVRSESILIWLCLEGSVNFIIQTDFENLFSLFTYIAKKN